MRSWAGTTMEAFFFDGEAGRLFGCHHPPTGGRARQTGVVVCGSVAEEYIIFHRALRQLALLLRERGFPVLRFDLYATGDSEGACEEGRVGVWRSDLEAAASELRRRSGAPSLALVGLRLGGALACSVAARLGDVGALALWDPVVDGKAFADEAAALYRDMLEYSHVDPRLDPAGRAESHLWGLPASGSTWSSIRDIDLLADGGLPAPEVLLIQSNEGAPLATYRRHLELAGARVAYQEHPNRQLWTWLEDFGKISVPLPVLRAVVEWLDEVTP